MEKRKTTTRDMTQGNIVKQVLLFALPLMLGNVFQMLYNTVDSIVVGNFVGTEALAAVGSTTMIVNMLVFFFNGFSIGAGVVIGRYFGARVYDTVIPRNVRLAEAPSHGRPITEYDAGSKGARAYLAAAEEFLQRQG